MRLAVPILLTATYALDQSQLSIYEPQQPPGYLTHLKAEEESCESAHNAWDSFEQNKAVTKELQTSFWAHGCSEFAASEIKLDGLNQASFVRMQCGWDLNLVFTQETSGSGRFLQTIIVPNKYGEAQLNVASVTGDESPQVFVHMPQRQSGRE
ncbi:MAG TPA: hypothetical protein VIX37_13695 [Candidatus Sulfotelmatobacter sp.]